MTDYYAEWDKVWSRLSAHFQPFFQLLLALSLSISGSLWLSVTPILAPTGSHCHSFLLWPSLAHYCSLISLTQSLIGSQRPCSALRVADALFLSPTVPKAVFLQYSPSCIVACCTCDAEKRESRHLIPGSGSLSWQLGQGCKHLCLILCAWSLPKTRGFHYKRQKE